MPKKKSVAPKVKKAGPKAPVGRPRKKLGTRVSDLPVVSTIKPMSRRSNIDSLALQRARLVYKRDYKKTISEDQARAFIDAMGAPKRGPIGERILGPRDDSRLRTQFINMVPEEGQKFIQLVKRAKTGFQKDKKDKVALKVKPDGTVVLHVPGFTDAPVATSGSLAASAVPAVPAANAVVSEEHALRVKTLLIDLGRLQEARAADPGNPELLRLERKLQKQVQKERNVLREGFPAKASTASTYAASEADIVEAMLPPEAPGDLALERGRQRLIALDESLPQAQRDEARARVAEITAQLVADAPAAAPAAPAAPVPAAVVEAALEAAPELVRQIEAEAPAITVPTGAPRSRRPSEGPVGPAEQDALLARLAELRDDPGNARLLEIARLAEEREQRGPQRPPVAVSKSLRRPRPEAAERQAAAEAAANALVGNIADMRNRDPRSSEAAHIAAVYRNQQEAQLALARERLRLERESRAKENEKKAQYYRSLYAPQIETALGAERQAEAEARHQVREFELLSALHEGRRAREREARAEENARKAQYYRSLYAPQIEAASFAIPQPGTPVQSESRYSTAPSTAAPSGYATPAVQFERSIADIEAVPQDLLDMIDTRREIAATRALVRQQDAENERLYRELDADKALIAALSNQARTEIGPPVPVQRNIPSTSADPFLQGWASTFPSSNIPVPPPPPPRPTARRPKRSRDNITMEALADALAKGLNPTQGTSTREHIATPREGSPSGLPPSVRPLPSAKDLQAAMNRINKKTKPAVESGPMDRLLVPVSVPSTVNSEMEEMLRKKFEAARGNKDDEPWEEDVPQLVEGALTNLGIDPEKAKDEEFSAAMSKKFTGKGLASKKFLKAVIKRARKTMKGGAMGGRMNDDRTDWRVLMDTMKTIKRAPGDPTGSGYFNSLDNVLNPMPTVHPIDSRKLLKDMKGGRVVLAGVPTPMSGCGKYTLQAVTFPDTDWKSSSSLRWLRSNGIKPIKKADRQGSLFRYRIVDPKGFKDYYTSELVSRGRKINLVYGSP